MTAPSAERGYEVVAFDASEEMVRLARARVGGRAAVHRGRFEDVAWRGEFDGVWACASLLHVRSAAFPDEATRLARSLRPGGAWYVSCKLGGGERVAADGRMFVTTSRGVPAYKADAPQPLRQRVENEGRPVDWPPLGHMAAST